jgi:3-oxoadipate enol-lactonase
MLNPCPTLLLLHPAATLAAVWRPLVERWAGSYHFIVPELWPGGDATTQLARWAFEIAAQIVETNTGPVHVVAASLGASVALRLVVTAPSLVASLTLDSAQIGGPPPPPYVRPLGRALATLTACLPPTLLANMLLSQFRAYQGADREAVREDMLRLGISGILGHLRAQFAHDIRREIEQIAVPTLLLAGEHDLLTRNGAQVQLQQALAGSRLVVVPGAGHVTFLSHPEALLQELPAFVV